MLMHRMGVLGFICVLACGFPAWSQAPSSPLPAGQLLKRSPAPVQPAAPEDETDLRSRINQWSVTILGGYNTGVLIRMAVDIQTAFEDGDNLRILPVVSHGAKQNVLDLLYLKGADIALTHADVFEELKKDPTIKNIDKRIQYISQLHISGIHILVRPEIKSLQDLQGKKVGFHGIDSGVDATASIIFPRLGLKVQKVNVPNQVGLEKMKTGELAGLVHLLTRKDPFLTKIPKDTGFHLLPINYSEKFADYYTPYTIEGADYPNLMGADDKVETLGLPAILAVYNWPKESDRYRRVQRFIEYFFTGFDKLKQTPYQEDWKTVSLSAKVGGWTRFPPAEEALAKLRQGRLARGTDRLPTETALDLSDQEQQRLFNEFLEWKKQRRK